jgi:hypothetical protein
MDCHEHYAADMQIESHTNSIARNKNCVFSKQTVRYMRMGVITVNIESLAKITLGSAKKIGILKNNNNNNNSNHIEHVHLDKRHH